MTTEFQGVPKRLVRSHNNRTLTGVAGGIGEYLGLDPVVVRLAFAAATILGGVGLWLYLAAWAFMPKDPHTASAGATAIARLRRQPVWAQVAVALFVALVILDGISGRLLVALALVGIGAAIARSNQHPANR